MRVTSSLVAGLPRRRVSILGLSASVSLCLALSGCGGSGAGTGGVNAAESHNATSNVAGYIISADFPVTAGDWAAGQQLGSFELSVQDKEIDMCMAHDGLPAPPPIMNEFTDNNIEFPDLQTLAKDGFSPAAIPNPPDPTQGMGSSERAAYRAADQRCATTAARPFVAINANGQVLKGEWADVLAKIDASPQVQRGLRHFASCTALAGYPGQSIQLFLQQVDLHTVPLFERRQDARASAVERTLGRVFERCLGPVQAIRTELRERQHALFLASHAQAIDVLRSTSDAMVMKLERQYGLKIPGVVPVQS